MIGTLRQWLGHSKYRLGHSLQAVAYRVPTPWSQHVISSVWEQQAELIHRQWGHTTHDFAVISRLLAQHRPQTLLDVGCGSGRLFGLYLQHGVTKPVGLDISAQALTLANERYPAIQTIQGRVEDLNYPTGYFDLAVCNRVLQHVPPHAIDLVVGQLCAICRQLYINELSESDQLPEEFFMFRHDYPRIFAKFQRGIVEEGRIGKQTYQLYGSV
jgi:SAM-dependent methyltransferase